MFQIPFPQNQSMDTYKRKWGNTGCPVPFDKYREFQKSQHDSFKIK
jgi:hypothetical protein